MSCHVVPQYVYELTGGSVSPSVFYYPFIKISYEILTHICHRITDSSHAIWVHRHIKRKHGR